MNDRTENYPVNAYKKVKNFIIFNAYFVKFIKSILSYSNSYIIK
jgi:hypothetical protein